MNQCPNCGSEIQDNMVFCGFCGQKIAPDQNEWSNTQQNLPNPSWQYNMPPYQQPYGSTANTTGQLVWSIINLVMCCLPLGIASLIIVTNAKNCITKEEFDSKMKSALICNIIATVGGFIVISLYIILVIFAAIYD